MNEFKTENWNGHEVRFVQHNGEWRAIAGDISQALGYRTAGDMTRYLDSNEQENINPQKLDESGLRYLRVGKNVKILKIISESGIYEAIFNSQKPEAREFKTWVKQILKELRQSSGFEGYQVFNFVTDKDIQKSLMDQIKNNISDATKQQYIKANTIADKAISNMFGYPKMVKKNGMTEDMLLKREQVLKDTVDLMVAADKFNLDLSVSKKIYERYH